MITHEHTSSWIFCCALKCTWVKERIQCVLSVSFTQAYTVKTHTFIMPRLERVYSSAELWCLRCKLYACTSVFFAVCLPSQKSSAHSERTAIPVYMLNLPQCVCVSDILGTLSRSFRCGCTRQVIFVWKYVSLCVQIYVCSNVLVPMSITTQISSLNNCNDSAWVHIASPVCVLSHSISSYFQTYTFCIQNFQHQ